MICFLDIDGVLVDFVGGMLKSHLRDNPWNDPANMGEWEMGRLLGLPRFDFWLPANNWTWWHWLKATEDGSGILGAVEKFFGRDSVYLLTTPASPHQDAERAGKLHWINKVYPRYTDRTFFGGPKAALAHSGSFLIDDGDDNVDQFFNAGGHAILVPRPWNSGHRWMGESASYVAGELECFAAESQRKGTVEDG